MKSNTAVKFSPIFTEEKKVEVTLNEDQAVIKLSTWVENLGWCGQKTLSLDAEILDDLHRVISAARLRLNKQKSDGSTEEPQSKVIQFPSFA